MAVLAKIANGLSIILWDFNFITHVHNYALNMDLQPEIIEER